MHSDILDSEALPGDKPPSGGAHPHNPIPPGPLAEMGDSIGENLGAKLP